MEPSCRGNTGPGAHEGSGQPATAFPAGESAARTEPASCCRWILDELGLFASLDVHLNTHALVVRDKGDNVAARLQRDAIAGPIGVVLPLSLLSIKTLALGCVLAIR